MARERFIEWTPSPESQQLIQQINAALNASRLNLTLRGLHYQMVRQNIYPNTMRSYKRLIDIVSKGRMAGLIDWDKLEDRLRRPDTPGQWSSPAMLAKLVVKNQWRSYRRATQPNYIEVWIEKDALSGWIGEVCDEEHVTMMVNRGYSSLSAMKEASERFIRAQTEDEQEAHILYLGDHDPSGEDMVRDVRDRLATFRAHVRVRKVALTREQIEEYDLPPNPAKTTDSRSDRYIDEHGDESWELDALPPEDLQALAREAIRELTDEDELQAAIDGEEKPRNAFVKRMDALLKEEAG